MIKLLQQLGIRTTSDKVLDALVKTPFKKIAEQNLEVPMNYADSTELTEINSETATFEPGMDYMSTTEQLSVKELMSSNDPFVRLGAFYELCIKQQKDFSDQIMPESNTSEVNYSEMLQSQNIIEDSIKVLFGRKADLSSVKEMLISIGDASKNVVNQKWSSTEMDDLRTALFIPSMQVIYVAMLNFVVMKALYTFLTKRGEIVAVSTKQETETRAKEAAMKPSTMPDQERAKMISKILNSDKMKELFNDNIIYTVGKTNMDPDRVKALKELVYYALGGKESPITSVKNWDIAKNPLDGNYDKFFAEIIREIQTFFEIPPLRSGVGDAKVGPNTKAVFKQQAPIAVTELLK
jgi:hypothetical protein